MAQRIIATIGVLALALAGACQSSSSPPADSSSASPAAKPAGPALVSPATLTALLPGLAGWQRTTPTSGSASLPAAATNASATYTRGKTKIDLEITDTGGAPEHVEAMSRVAGSDFSQQASNGYMKGTVVAGFPAIESWNHVDHVADLSVLINGRFIVHASGTDVDKIETMRQLVEAVDVKRIADLK